MVLMFYILLQHIVVKKVYNTLILIWDLINFLGLPKPKMSLICQLIDEIDIEIPLLKLQIWQVC